MDATPANELTIARLRQLLGRDEVRYIFTLERSGSEIKIDTTVTTIPVSGLI